jgi:subtilase family serine protease
VGTYIGEEPPNKGVKMRYKGMAKWSGTSFATPVIAGLTAARMSKTGENGVTAARELIKQAQDSAIPGLGAIARPEFNFND